MYLPRELLEIILKRNWFKARVSRLEKILKFPVEHIPELFHLLTEDDIQYLITEELELFNTFVLYPLNNTLIHIWVIYPNDIVIKKIFKIGENAFQIYSFEYD